MENHWREAHRRGGYEQVFTPHIAQRELWVTSGHVGYYAAGMNQQASIRVRGNCGVGVAENMMSGSVVIEGSASSSAGATARGGLLVVHGDASAR